MKDFVKFVIFKDDNKKIRKLIFLLSIWIESCMVFGVKICWGLGKNGSFSLGVVVSIMVLLRIYIILVKWFR